MALLVTACGGPHFNGTVYDDGKLHFRTGPIPSAWHAIEADGTLLAFRDDATPATVALNGRCGVDGRLALAKRFAKRAAVVSSGARIFTPRSFLG